jgi:hypothetical protein
MLNVEFSGADHRARCNVLFAMFSGKYQPNSTTNLLLPLFGLY